MIPLIPEYLWNRLVFIWFLCPFYQYTVWKVSKYRVFSGPYFPAFGPEKTPYLDSFHAVVITAKNGGFCAVIYKYIFFLVKPGCFSKCSVGTVTLVTMNEKSNCTYINSSSWQGCILHPCSSVPSRQSWSPSHFHSSRIHLVLSHLKCLSPQVFLSQSFACSSLRSTQS